MSCDYVDAHQRRISRRWLEVIVKFGALNRLRRPPLPNAVYTIPARPQFRRAQLSMIRATSLFLSIIVQ